MYEEKKQLLQQQYTNNIHVKYLHLQNIYYFSLLLINNNNHVTYFCCKFKYEKLCIVQRSNREREREWKKITELERKNGCQYGCYEAI